MSVTAAPSRLPTSPIRYYWPRFWIPQTGILDLSDAGFLRDPVDSLYGSGSLRTLSQLETYPALALPGEPGIGKSATLTGEHDRVSALPPDQGVHSVYVNLNATASEDRLYRQVFESAEMGGWKAGNTRLFLHLDSLDEAMLRIETVPHLLSEGLRALPADRLCVRIACRTAIWPAATLGRTLTSIWGESRLGVFELAPLRRRDVLNALLADGINPDKFISRLFGAQAGAFAIKPLTLKMLIALFKRDGRFPTSTGDLYRQGCLALCRHLRLSLWQLMPAPIRDPRWWKPYAGHGSCSPAVTCRGRHLQHNVLYVTLRGMRRAAAGEPTVFTRLQRRWGTIRIPGSLHALNPLCYTTGHAKGGCWRTYSVHQATTKMGDYQNSR